MIPKELLSALRQIEIHTSRLATDALSGNYTSVFRGQGMVFREVRPYQPGDDVRQIDWNVSARMGQAYVKLFTEEREMTVMLLVDVSASGHFGTKKASKARVAAEVAALLAFSAIKNGDRVGLVMVSDRVERIVPPRKGEKHVLRVAREVLGAEPTGSGTDLAAGLEALVRLSKRRSVAFVISDFFVDTSDALRAAVGTHDGRNGRFGHNGRNSHHARNGMDGKQRFERALSLAAAKHDLIAVELRDPRDEELPDLGLALLEDLESGDELVVDTSSKRVRESYAKELRTRRAAVLSTLRRLSIDCVSIQTDGSYVKPLRELFLRRARRAKMGGG